MNRYWHYIAFRIVMAIALGITLSRLAQLLTTLLVWIYASSGELDFAGAAIVHISPIAALVWIIPFVGFAEIYAWCHKRPLPFSSYLVFFGTQAVCIALSLLILPTFLSPDQAWIYSLTIGICVLIASLTTYLHFKSQSGRV